MLNVLLFSINLKKYAAYFSPKQFSKYKYGHRAYYFGGLIGHK